jgi:transcriptional regulator with XRE-family HTH domain
MNLGAVGRLIGAQRRAQGLTLPQLAAKAGVARSTLAALESGKLAELGFNRVVRLCAALEMVVDVRQPRLRKPLMEHRHLTTLAGRELTRAAIDDIISRGDVEAWRGLVKAVRSDRTGVLTRRVGDVARAASADPRARAFAAMLPRLRQSGARKRRSRA